MPLDKHKLQPAQIKQIVAQPNFGNDYNAYYHHTGVLPQEHITNKEDPYKGYPKLQKLRELKKEHHKQHTTPIKGHQCEPTDMPEVLSKWARKAAGFDVLMVGGCSPEFDYKRLEQLPIDKISPRPSILFLWVPPWKLAEGQALIEAWGFRRSEDIAFAVGSKQSPFWIDSKHQTSKMLFVPTTWHCYMALKGTLRRSDDNHLINCNIDTDVILENESTRANIVPEQIYELVERFSLMSRRIHIVPFRSPDNLPVRLRPGWVVVSPDVMLQNVSVEAFRSQQLVPVHAEVDELRPKTPPRGFRA